MGGCVFDVDDVCVGVVLCDFVVGCVCCVVCVVEFVYFVCEGYVVCGCVDGV